MMTMSGNLFLEVDSGAQAAELVTRLLERPGLQIERIVSTGQASPPGFWYDEPDGEWVLLLSGEARLLIEREAQPRFLKAGDWLNLPPHCRHRVEWTAPDQQTVWLAVRYRDPTAASR